MNCPHCGERNPSTAKRCLHCHALFEQESPGLLDLESPEGGNTLVWVFGIAVVGFIGGAMLLFGFDTVESKCVKTAEAAEQYEASPEWTRSTSAERFRRDQERRRRDDRNTSRAMLSRPKGFLRCYEKKTGHVDGLVE